MHQRSSAMKWDARRSRQVRSFRSKQRKLFRSSVQQLVLCIASAQFYDEGGRKKIATGAQLP
jgi:hypothetical protein